MADEKEIPKGIKGKLFVLQQTLKVPKNNRNNFGNYNYRSCEDIVETVKPLLRTLKLILTMSDDVVFTGNYCFVKTTITLEDRDSDEKISTTGLARDSIEKKGMDAAQITGAASSYARKYALNGLLAIDDAKDADATNKHNKK